MHVAATTYIDGLNRQVPSIVLLIIKILRPSRFVWFKLNTKGLFNVVPFICILVIRTGIALITIVTIR